MKSLDEMEKDEYLAYLEQELEQMKITIEKKDATIKELVELFMAHGIEITGIE